MDHYPLIDDERGPLLMLSPADAISVTSALTAASIAFEEDDTVGAGCAGPEVVVLRFPASVDREELQRSISAALLPGQG